MQYALWAHRGSPLALTFCKPERPLHKADFIDQSRKFCCAVNGSQCDPVCTCWQFHFSVWNWWIWLIARKAEVCLSPWHASPSILACPRPCLAQPTGSPTSAPALCYEPQVILLTTGVPLNSLGSLACEDPDSNLQFSPPHCVYELLGQLLKFQNPSFHGESICTVYLKSLKATSHR